MIDFVVWKTTANCCASRYEGASADCDRYCSLKLADD
jgi:hypothetical protein